MFGLMTIGQMAERLGVSVCTMRRWDREGKLKPQSRTEGGHRRYTIDPVAASRRTICYARVSCADQKDDLERQKQRLITHAEACGYDRVECLADVGSGLNCRKKGLLKLIDLILRKEVARLVIENKDRLLRFGADLLLRIAQAMDVAIEIVEAEAETTSESDLAKDVLAIITVFSARLYGARSHSRRKALVVDSHALGFA